MAAAPVTDPPPAKPEEPKAKSEEQESHKAVAVSVLVNPKMLHAMGRDLAAIHRGTPRRRQAIVDDLDVRPRDWLLKAVKAAEESIKVEWAEWRDYYNAEQKRRKKAKSA